MKHILLNKDGQEHARILQCPFQYVVPRNLTAIEPVSKSKNKSVTSLGMQDNVTPQLFQEQATNFAVVRNGIVESVIVWGGAEWCPPQGTTIVPLPEHIGVGDSFNEEDLSFSICAKRLSKRDIDKTPEEIEAEELQRQKDLERIQNQL